MTTSQSKILTLSERQSGILAHVEESGYETIEGLSERYGVSAQTIRRDIIALSNAGRLQRFHGGAGLVEPIEATRLDYRSKREIGASEKYLVGKMAADLIPDGAILFLDVGTTIEACAEQLSQRKGFTIFTNSMPAAMKFDPGENQIFVLGGKVAGRDGSLVGLEAPNILKEVHLDYALIGCSAIDPNGRVMDYDLEKIAIKKAAMKSAKKSLLLAIHSKFNQTALAVIAQTKQFDNVVTEGHAPNLVLASERDDE
jgi:DeoR family glycerol-3-phosphate regulon repressor